MVAWAALRRLGSQVRTVTKTIGLGGQIESSAVVCGLDYGAAISFAKSIGADNALFLELLTEVEAMIVRSYRQGDS